MKGCLRIALAQLLATASAFYPVGSGVSVTAAGLHHPRARMNRCSHGLQLAKMEVVVQKPQVAKMPLVVAADIVKPPSPASAFVKAGVGSLAIFGLERSLWVASTAAHFQVPTAMSGMLIVWLMMLVIDKVSPKAALKVLDWFNPARAFYGKGVPLFFSPPLVQLPLTLSVLPLMSILKFFTIIVTGVVVSITTTGLATNLLISKKKIDTNVKIVSVGGITSSGKTDEKAISTTAKPADPWESPVMKAAFAGMCLFAALRLDMLLIACASVFSLQFGKALPAAVRAICPAVITCAGLTAAVVSGLGFLNGVEVATALAAHKTAVGGIFGGTGVGDFLFLGAAPAIVALGFNLFEQRSVLMRSLIPIVGGACITATLSVLFTALVAHVLHCEPIVGLSLVTRFVTLPMAVPFVDQIHANLGLAAAAVVIQGIVGATFGRRLLDLVGVKNNVARGVAIGGTSHALGTASLAIAEPKIAPPSAVTFLVTGTLMDVLIQSGWFAQFVIHLVTDQTFKELFSFLLGEKLIKMIWFF